MITYEALDRNRKVSAIGRQRERATLSTDNSLIHRDGQSQWISTSCNRHYITCSSSREALNLRDIANGQRTCAIILNIIG